MSLHTVIQRRQLRLLAVTLVMVALASLLVIVAFPAGAGPESTGQEVPGYALAVYALTSTW